MRGFFPCLCSGLFLAALVAGAGLPAPARADTTAKQAATKKKLAKVKKHIAALTDRQRKTAAQRNAINATLASQADKLSAAVHAVHQSNQAIAANQHKLDALEKHRDKLKTSLNGQRQALAELLRAAYKIQPGSGMRLLLGHADVARLARALAYSRYFQHDRVQHIHQLLKQLDDLKQVQADITHKRQALEAAHRQKRQRLAKLKHARQRQQALLAKVKAQIKNQHEQMHQLKHNRQSLEDLLAQLRDVFADIPKKLPAGIPFAKRRGKLPWPVHGKASRYSDGLHIDAKRGATVRAVAHGRVAYADWLRGYGLLIVISQGDGWMSLYGGNESLKVGVGDWVSAGQPIATAGASAAGGSGVYFGLRHDGKAVDPLPWLVDRQ